MSVDKAAYSGTQEEMGETHFLSLLCFSLTQMWSQRSELPSQVFQRAESPPQVSQCQHLLCTAVETSLSCLTCMCITFSLLSAARLLLT